MTVEDPEVRLPARNVVSATSLACDLSWLISTALRPLSRPNPLASELLGARPEIGERLRAFWAGSSPETCFTEMQVLAHHAGVLTETSPAALWDGLAGAISTVPTDWGLESESPEDRAVFIDRLVQLKASPALFRTYLDLLRELWEPVDDIWQSALPAAEEAGRRVVAQLESGGELSDLLNPQCEVYRRAPSISARVDAGYPLLIVPCVFFGQSLYLEFPGLTLIGSGFERTDFAARARTESLARRLKTVADPTRLALLHYLAGSPSTVGDLAASFGLAQPTVSMHMKSLRESGLVRAERKGGRVQLSADVAAVETLLDELRGAVVRTGG
jgi:ArsR family transcriptional regulator